MGHPVKFLRFALGACARALQSANVGPQYKKQERAYLGGGALELQTRNGMVTHATRAGKDSTAAGHSQTFRQWRNRLGNFARLLLTPAQPPRLELRDSLSHPDHRAAPRARASRPARPYSVARADARARSAYCECLNHTPALHRCGLTAVATLEQYGQPVRACQYHANRGVTFGLPVAYDSGVRVHGDSWRAAPGSPR